MDVVSEDPGRRTSGPKRRRGLIGIPLFLLKAAIIVALPFVALLRGSVFFHVSYRLNVWLSLISGAFLTFILLFLYLSFLERRILRNRAVTKAGLKRKVGIVGVLLLVYCGYSLIYLSGANAKTEEVKREFTALLGQGSGSLPERTASQCRLIAAGLS